jgi:hypothetical protein
MHKPSLIFFVYPDPTGSEENQFTPLGAGVNKLIFKRFFDFVCIITDSHINLKSPGYILLF